jgi:hypothetical protein
MFKSLYGLCGELAASLTDFATAISVDDAMLAKLRLALTGTDYTYLILKTSTTYEIVKTNSFVANTIAVTRAQDGTVAQTFPAGTVVEFVLGDQAIADMINDRMLGQINIVGAGVVQVTKTSQNNFSIYAPPVNIVSESDKILVGGEFPNFVLSAPLVSGCCD